MSSEPWESGSVGDVLVPRDERYPKGGVLPHYSLTIESGLIPKPERYDRDFLVRDKNKKYKAIYPDDIVFNPANLRWGAIAICRADGPVLASPIYEVLRIRDPRKVLPEFVFTTLSTPGRIQLYEKFAEGTLVERTAVKLDQFLRFDILLPPIGEQRKISAILSSVEDAIEATQAVIDQLQVVKKAMMAELLTRGLPGRHTRFKQTEIGEVPEGWEVVSLGNLLVDVHAGWSPQCESGPAGEDEWGVLKVSAVSWDEFRADENKRLPATFVPRPEIEVKVGDLLVSRANTPELVGRSVYVASTRSLVMLSDKIMRLVPDRQRADPRFINFVLGAPVSRDQIENAATGSSRSMKNLSQEKLRGVLVAAPPLAEQIQVMGLVDSTTERIAMERNLLASMRHLKSAFMSVLLTGEVRVTSDEVAA